METKTKHIVFITGAFVTHKSWLHWKTYFEGKGYTCSLEPWPHKDKAVEELRARQGKDLDLALMPYSEVLDHYERIIKQMPEKPILIGHSVGGLTTQLLLQRGIAVAGIAIHPAPPQGVLSFKWSFLRAVWHPLAFFTSARKTHLMSFPQWQYAFTNGMDFDEQLMSYEENVIPESKTVLRNALGRTAHIDFERPHAPLLILSGSIDNIIPASLNLSNFKRYKNRESITDYKEFEAANHYVVSAPGWKRQADYILDWITKYGI
ncbi:alpha/beta fold hydrolase [Flavobacterium sp. MAH-1]|uniref:Alpha/beta fold hydrolase n=1 Tax=Flavobacterium agri TaxID=2743471 RepID=A0A7Y9C6E7_9FLAO|nr:alpha/beta hydrolase [Flavobacterium agri]NUY81976.1 alpha/beta fold hydrolase [Flavobacterium agri]NYA72000.1 alpha/beta fold hydrolase [Flavobacterium agri]